jgi:CRP-like cAMP-binding protein
VLYEAGEPIDAVYFPLNSVASLRTITDDGAAVEVALIGWEGAVGLPLFLGLEHDGLWAMNQVPGAALTMSAAAFRSAPDRWAPLRQVVGRFAHVVMVQIAQVAGCHRLHPVDERCARWLLQVHDRVGSDTFPLTQDFLATMLGVRRPSVTIAVGLLQRAGLVGQRRGRITVLDRAGLEAAACECYRTLATAIDQLLGGDLAL